MSLQLPEKIEKYVSSLSQIYKINGKLFLQQILANSVISIEQHSYDNWDGGQYGFLLHLQVPDAIFAKILDAKDKYESDICNRLNKLINISGELIDSVSLEMQLLEDDNWREKSGLVLPSGKHISDNILERIWYPGCLRAFLCHISKYKTKVGQLKSELKKYSISCFLAHIDIEPTKEWVQEIENALFSMDILIALMSKDFHESNWTDQEVGVSVGRHIPVIPVKIGNDPYGFIGKYQALSGSWEDISKMAKDIFIIILNHSATKEKMKRSAINALKNSSSYDDSHFLLKNVLPCFKKMEDSYIEEIISSFNENRQIFECFSAKHKLPNLLYQWTGNKYHIVENKLVRIESENVSTDEFPF